MAVGVEKVKDSGYQGLNAFPDPERRHASARSPPPPCSRWSRPPTPSATASTEDELKAGARPHRVEEPLQRRPQPAGPVPPGDVGRADPAPCPTVAGCLVGVRLRRRGRRRGRRRSSCRAEDAHRYTDTPLYVKALSFVAGNGSGLTDPGYDYTTFPEIVALRRRTPTPRPASPTRGAELAMAEVHDCFTPTELVLMEDLGLLRAGHGVEGDPGRRLRPRRRPAGQPRRRPQVLRPPGRRVAACA